MTKQLDLHGLMGYHAKDNIHIFHLIPSKLVFDHWNCYRKVQEKVAWSCEHQKADISPVLSYSTVKRTPFLLFFCLSCQITNITNILKGIFDDFKVLVHEFTFILNHLRLMSCITTGIHNKVKKL